ncbi:hypothetical protein Bhyg_02769 [Pseudolycoriella hygida]|uniref:Uncharacterized protein n=1 Tax=Pseudolycoriella hygida TaxID=35572 RepID=A0A9Q0NC22_9DIPT|nr:hypothetical protein Bhyg_02769 [Pseudolycoriella hygida]
MIKVQNPVFCLESMISRENANPSQIENEVADPDSESDDDEVIKIQHHRRYRITTTFPFLKNNNHKICHSNCLPLTSFQCYDT